MSELRHPNVMSSRFEAATDGDVDDGVDVDGDDGD